MTISTQQVQALASGSGKVRTTAGGKIGSIGQIYLDDNTEQPSWVTVKTGLFGTSESFVPLQDAQVDGDDVVVPYDEDKIKNAPRVDADGSLSREEEDELYRYYGVGGTGTTTSDYATTGTTSGTGYDDVTTDATTNVNQHGTAGHDTSGPTTDDAMTLSEERLEVGTQTREAGRARLRKYVVTENVTQTVPVSHEEVRIEREPITDGNVGAATSGPDISEEEHEVILHEERPVVQKETVPVERVRLDTETVTENATVSDEVRREEVEVSGDGTATTHGTGTTGGTGTSGGGVDGDPNTRI